MKNIVINEQYAQTDLKPSKLLEEYVALLNTDVRKYLGNNLKSSGCSACGSNSKSNQFEKFGFIYHECGDCASLYVSPRPSDAAIASFFTQAPSKIFWREKLSEASRQSRKAKIIKPRIEWIMDSSAEYIPAANHWVDIHTAQERYLEAMAASKFRQKTLIAPYCHIKTPEIFTIVNQPLDQVTMRCDADLVTLFEVMDHAADPGLLLNVVHGLLKKGGLCFITCILASGLDVKELGANAQNIYPPDRLNVFSAKGLQALCAKHGFECLEFSTPGILDLNIIATALKHDPSISVSPFIKALALDAPVDVRANFQEFLQANMLSSYGRMLIRKV